MAWLAKKVAGWLSFFLAGGWLLWRRYGLLSYCNAGESNGEEMKLEEEEAWEKYQSRNIREEYVRLENSREEREEKISIFNM